MKQQLEDKHVPSVDSTLYQQIQEDPEIKAFLDLADEHLGVIGYTEHGARHGARVAKWAGLVLGELGFSKEDCELARVAGYLHDIGNFICRTDHGQTGACLLYPILRRYPFSERELGLVLSAIGNHEEQYGQVFNNICAAVVVADKSDVHRSRVRDYDPSRGDIHDDVNYAVTRSNLVVDKDLHEIRLELEIDDSIASVMDYFEIFLERMVMCRNACEFLGCSFRIVCNGTSIS
jgi:metal-dependent HD superfamily phosphatase/phosphodiesterase